MNDISPLHSFPQHHLDPVRAELRSHDFFGAKSRFPTITPIFHLTGHLQGIAIVTHVTYQSFC